MSSTTAVTALLILSLTATDSLITSNRFATRSTRFISSNPTNNVGRSRNIAVADISNIVHDHETISSSLTALQHMFQLPIHEHTSVLQNSFNIAIDDATLVPPEPVGEVSIYSKVDKTGFIGFFADYIEQAIDAGHRLIQALGVKSTYGYSIVLFTVFSKLVNLD